MQRDVSAATTSTSFHGFIKDPYDALLLITAARLGLIPRFRRRLNTTERHILIGSGSVFLWTEEESCMKRWTDGYPWSPSRIQLGFLLYREMADRGSARSRTSSRLAESDTNETYPTDERPDRARRRKTVRVLAGSLFNHGELDEIVRRRTSGGAKSGDIFKRGGLMKKTFCVSLPGATWHLVSYYSLDDAVMGRLQTPKESPYFEGMNISEDLHEVYATSVRRESLGVCMSTLVETLPAQIPVASGFFPIDSSQSPQSSSGDTDSTFPLDDGYPQDNLIATEASVAHSHQHVVDGMSPAQNPFNMVYFQDDAGEPAWPQSFHWQPNTPTSLHLQPPIPGSLRYMR